MNAVEEVLDRTALRRDLRVDAVEPGETGVRCDLVVDDIPVPGADTVDRTERVFEPLLAGAQRSFGIEPRGRLVALVEDTENLQAGLVEKRREIVVPTGVLNPPAALHGQHLALDAETLAAGQDIRQLGLDDVPDVRPDLARGASERPGVLFTGDRRPGVIIEKAKLRAPIDRGRDLGVEAEIERHFEGGRPGRSRAQGGRRPIHCPHAFAEFTPAGKELLVHETHPGLRRRVLERASISSTLVIITSPISN